ncbi:MAG: hypothetical protein JWM95_3504, partial [Gemmatimonadetes bacterium]|nr:hypothetical protein [Gemmatimonadota bacterium]
MGELWLAERCELGGEVVIKFIVPELQGRARSVERLAREAASAARINSPHVVRILDYGTAEDGSPFLVMEKLEGRDLDALLRERRSLEPRTVLRVARQVARALEKAHAAGIIHRDVKPSNVFLCEPEDEVIVKLLDFGIARSTTQPSGTASGTAVGTPAYMSPEQIVGSTSIDARTDVWALGVLTFECLTGRRPFPGEATGAVALAIHTLPTPRPSEVSPSLPPAVDAWFARACARS